MRSIFELSVDELEAVMVSNALPSGVSLAGIEERKDFSKLFAHRASPEYIARIVLKEKTKERVSEPKPPKEPKLPVEPRQVIYTGQEELKSQRLALKQEELALKQRKQEGITVIQERMIKRLDSIDETLDTMLKLLFRLTEQ